MSEQPGATQRLDGPLSAPSAEQPPVPTMKPTTLPRGRRATPRKPNDHGGVPEHEVGVFVIVQKESRSPTRSASTWQARTGQIETREASLSAQHDHASTFAAQASTCAQKPRRHYTLSLHSPSPFFRYEVTTEVLAVVAAGNLRVVGTDAPVLWDICLGPARTAVG